ncbi:MAG: inositol monophosphatase family protein [Acidimicrobiales bacterium]
MDDEALLRVCHEVVDAVASSLRGVVDWRPSGQRPGQYAIDLVADRAALEVLEDAGLGVLSEESGARHTDAGLVAVLDPVDGSTNASRGVPWYATSICIVDAEGPRVAVVANLATGDRYHAARGRGAWRGETRLHASECRRMNEAVVALSGYPRRHLGWAQYRAFGAAALDLCAVAEGMVDAFATGGRAHLGSWDYMGGILVCSEAGAYVTDFDGLELVTLDPAARRAVGAAATPELLEQLRAGIVDSRPPGA